MRIAMWSGPRNLSTAMMYSFGARSDCAVLDEPYYAAYLKKTGQSHPMDAEIIAAGETDPAAIEKTILGPIPAQKPIFYQKHMTHHMIDGFDRAWMHKLTNVFLIRHPARVVASYARKREKPTLEDTGFVQQLALYKEVIGAGARPVVVDSFDVRNDPRKMLTALCGALGISFEDSMLNWPAGGRVEDGVWARHWYGAVHRSTGFAWPEGPLPEMGGEEQIMVKAAMPFYETLKSVALEG